MAFQWVPTKFGGPDVLEMRTVNLDPPGSVRSIFRCVRLVPIRSTTKAVTRPVLAVSAQANHGDALAAQPA
jgi:hypothetical protein